MSKKTTNRQLTTILMADVVGYSRLISEDEKGTLAQLIANRTELFVPKLEEHNGRAVKWMGDGVLVEFNSITDALSFAVEIQSAVNRRNQHAPPLKQISYRIGINIGDILVDDNDIYGDCINVAARIEPLCEPGGIYLTENAYQQAKNRHDVDFQSLGKKKLKSIKEPVGVYRVLLASGDKTLPPDKPRALLSSPWLWLSIVAILIISLVAARIYFQPSTGFYKGMATNPSETSK